MTDKTPTTITIDVCATCGRTSLGTATGTLPAKHRDAFHGTGRRMCRGTARSVTYTREVQS